MIVLPCTILCDHNGAIQIQHSLPTRGLAAIDIGLPLDISQKQAIVDNFRQWILTTHERRAAEEIRLIKESYEKETS